jgi:hypothetical protein
MRKFSFVLMAVGVIIIIIGFLTFTNLNTVNAVDSHRWTIYINGIRSFPWPVFAGSVIVILGVIFNMATWEQPKGRYF